MNSKASGVPVAVVKGLANEVAAKGRGKKQVTVCTEPVHLADGSALKPLEVKDSSDVLRASLLMLFKHVADIHVTVVEIVADKFGLKIDDIHSAITEDPRWANIFLHPLVSDLTATCEANATSAPKTKKHIVISEEPDLVFD